MTDSGADGFSQDDVFDFDVNSCTLIYYFSFPVVASGLCIPVNPPPCISFKTIGSSLFSDILSFLIELLIFILLYINFNQNIKMSTKYKPEYVANIQGILNQIYDYVCIQLHYIDDNDSEVIESSIILDQRIATPNGYEIA